MNIKESLAEMLKTFKGKSITFTDSTTFDELGFDSLDKVEMLMELEEKYQISFEDDIQISTFGELIQKIEQLKKK